MDNKYIYIMLTIFAGIAVTMQGPINAALGRSLKSSDLATFWSFVSGTVIIGIYLLIKRVPMPSLELLSSVPWWAWLGALTGIIYVSIVILVIPRLGAGTATVLLILAQILTAIVLDKVGAFGVDVKDITFVKMIGVFLMLGGVVLVSR